MGDWVTVRAMDDQDGYFGERVAASYGLDGADQAPATPAELATAGV